MSEKKSNTGNRERASKEKENSNAENRVSVSKEKENSNAENRVSALKEKENPNTGNRASALKAKENPHAGHRERLRKKFIANGFENFADHEVLEFLLFYCYPQRNTNDIAHRMIKKFGSLHNLFETDVEILMSTLEISENVAVLLNLIPKVAKKYFLGRWGAGLVIDDEKIAGEYAIDLFLGETKEKLYMLCLDMNYKLINAALVSEGTIDETNVFPREIVAVALRNNASFVILSHNHPSGTLEPSRADNELTRRIVEISEPLSIKIIDHIVVAGDKYFSYAARRKYVRGYL
jgi:DNA repair protein RadC